MKAARPIIFLVLVLGVRGALADWDEGDPYKMHWPQLPDLSPEGIDVNATAPNILADDFYCIADGPITSIHIWGSWRSDSIDSGAVFVLSIHTDIPTNENQQYSMPGTTVWWKAFSPTEYTVRIYQPGLNEGWLDPPDQYTPNADTICYQYNFPIPLEEAFVQTNGNIYWLNVQCQTRAPGPLFGWKTTEPTNRWNDDACWAQGEEPNPIGWTNLVYPPDHPLQGETLDLAFVIEGETHETPTNPLCPKWIQPPDCDRGLDVESWELLIPTQSTMRVADDWLCDGRPVHGLRWWGSYSGWQTNTPGPVGPPTNSRPIGFRLFWYFDVPASPTNYSHPGQLITNYYFELSPYGQTNALMVQEQYYCSSELDFAGSNVWEHEFSYFIEFTNAPWMEKETNIYWLGIVAVYAVTPTQYLWGWKTTSPQWHWNDDAVWTLDPPDWQEMRYPPPGWDWVTNHPYAGLSADMAFELLTHICPSRCRKWLQPPDMQLGMNASAYTVGTNLGIIQADDFISDGRPITDIHWWGSYIGWESSRSGSATNPVPPPAGSNRVTGFRLSWHLDNNCQPGILLTNIFVPITNCHETYYGSVFQEWNGSFEHEYQYYVDLLDVFLDTLPWYETNGGHYWLDIQAVFSTNWEPGAVHNGWGWKTTPQTSQNACVSMFSSDGGLTWTTNCYPAGHPLAGQSYDLSFELTTTNLPVQSNMVINVVFTNVFRTNFPGETYMWSTGYCGCGKQVLQVTTDLVAGAWADVFTNPAPRSENLWRGQTGSTHLFYRVLQKP